MRYTIIILAISTIALQSCKNEQDNRQEEASVVIANNEPAQQQEAAMVMEEPVEVNDGTTTNDVRKNTKTQQVAKNDNAINYSVRTKANTYRQPANKTNANRLESDNVYVQTTGKNNEKLVAAYQVPTKEYNKEVSKVCENKTTANAEATKYQCVTIKQGNIVATYDMPGDDYRGEEVLSHDGVAKNKERNINYLDFSVSKVPIDGGRWDE